MKGQKSRHVIGEFMAFSGHFISQVKQSKQFRPQIGRPSLSALMFRVGHIFMHRPQALHFSAVTHRSRLYICLIMNRFMRKRSRR